MAHSDGRIIPIPDEDDTIHSDAIVKNPETFGTSHEELRRVTPMGLLQGGASNDFSIQQHMASKGWLRGTHSTEVFERDGRNHTEHHFNLSQEGNEGTPEHFMKAVESLRDLHSGPSHSNVIMLNGLARTGEGSKKWESVLDSIGHTRRFGTPGSLALTQTDHINKFVGSGSIKRDRNPAPAPHIPTSTEILSNIKQGKEQSTAEFNYWRTMGLGASYKSDEYPILLENIIHRLFSTSPVNKNKKNKRLIPPVTKVTPIDRFTPSLPKPGLGIYDKIKKVRASTRPN